jgi:hypothetical protein
MKLRTSVLTLALCFVAGAVCFAASDAQMGTWKLNEAKSKLPTKARNNTVVYEAAGDSVKVSIDGIDPDGKSVHTEWTGKFDGKDYPVTGDSTSDARSYKQVDDHTLTFAGKQGGKVTISGRIVVSADGKTRTVTNTVTDAAGKKVKGTAVYDKQ